MCSAQEDDEPDYDEGVSDVRAVGGPHPGGRNWKFICLDTGSDENCCPPAFGDGPLAETAIQTRDVQHRPMRVDGVRDTEFSLKCLDGTTLQRETKFIVGAAAKPVMSIGPDVDRGGILHLGNGKSYFQPADSDNKVLIVRIKRSFYAQLSEDE